MNAVEITTQIGCKVLCKYCPQDKLVKSYKSSKKVMTLNDFKKILSNINKSTTVIFSGFSEPLLNKDSVDMMIYAYNNGFSVELWTTFVGLLDKHVDKLEKSKIIFDRVVFHRFKSSSFDVLESSAKFKNFRKKIQSLIYQQLRVIKPLSRAGNNFEYNSKAKNIRCVQDKTESNVVLPNGDLFLCCNDFSLKHKLGNLYIDNINSNNIKKSKKNMMLKDSLIICKHCECSESKNAYGVSRGDLEVKTISLKAGKLKMIKSAQAVKRIKVV
ncbi:hypothetical protein MASR1M68_09960 [Elusimicrobiota bacterium]